MQLCLSVRFVVGVVVLVVVLLHHVSKASLLPPVSTVVFTTDAGAQRALSDFSTAYLALSNSATFQLTQGSSISSVVASVTSQSADFAVLGTGLSEAQSLTYPNLQLFPAMCFALVPIYRLDALGDVRSTSGAPQLVLDRPTIAKIFMGEITWWNDSELQATNPSLTLPAQRITVALPHPGVTSTLIWTTALSKFYASFNSSIGATAFPVWPKSLYYRVVSGFGATGQASAVVANDGTLSFAYHSIALELQCNIAALINKAGNIVTPSVSSVTFAAVELGTAAGAKTSSMDLTDASGSSAWPVAVTAFLLIDMVYARSTCHVRAAVVEFWLQFYTNAFVTKLLATHLYAPVPSIVLAQLKVIDQLTMGVMCRNIVAYDPPITTTRLIGATNSVSFLSGLFTNLYGNVDNSIIWEVQTNTDELILQQILQGELDIAFLDPDNIDSRTLETLLNDPDYLTLPTFLFAPALGYNPQITPTINIASETVTLDMGTVGLIFFSCIVNWNDPVIVRQNPWLALLLPTLTNSSVSISLIKGCGSTAAAPLGTAFFNAFTEYLQDTGDMALTQCMDQQLPSYLATLQACQSLPADNNLLFVAAETSIGYLVQGTVGAMGFIQATDDPSYGWVTITDHRDGVWTNTTATVAGMSACALDTIDLAAFQGIGNPLGLSPASTDPNCYRPTQQVTVVARNLYSSTATDTSGCERGFDALSFLHWFYTNAAVDVLVGSVDQVRVSTLSPDVLTATLQALDGVMCDDQSLLFTAPVEWSLSTGVRVVVLLVSSLGLAASMLLVGFVCYYRAQPVIRSASPLFLLQSVAGVCLLFAAGYPLVATTSSISCAAFSWLVNGGMMLTFAPLFAKTWRIYRIFGRKKLSVVVISNKKLIVMVAGLLALEVVLMATWQAVGILQPIVKDLHTSSNVDSTVAAISARLVVDEYVQCGVPAGAARSIFAIVCVEKALLCVWGALMAFSTRKVTSTFNESAGITLAIYNVCFTIGIVTPIILVIDAVGDVLTILLAFALLWIASFTTVTLFGPKLITVISKYRETAPIKWQSGSTGDSSSGYQFVSLAALSSASILQGYLAALEKHVLQVKDKLSKLKTQHKGYVETSTSSAHQLGGTASVPGAVASPTYSVRHVQHDESGASGALTPAAAERTPARKVNSGLVYEEALQIHGHLAHGKLLSTAKAYDPAAAARETSTKQLQPQQSMSDVGSESRSSALKRS